MKMIKNSLKAVSFVGAVKLSGFIKVSFLVGSQMIWFSGVNSVLPLAGAFGGVIGAGLIFLLRQLMYCVFFKTVSFSFLALSVPGFCAALYWTTNHYLIRVGLPLACMGLFMAHPVGAQAFIYSFYWLIPVAVYLMPRKSLFSEALGSTFTAHAVGSVIWLYTMPTTVDLWIGLMPLVLVERIIFALGMVGAHWLLASLFGTMDKVVQRREQSAFLVTRV